MKMKNIISPLFVCALLCACSNFVVSDLVSFERVDPLKKVYKEANYFKPFEDTVRVAAGEHAVFQFAIRSSFPLENLNVDKCSFVSEDGAYFDQVEVGFVEYVHSGRQVPSNAKDAQYPISLCYPDPIMTVPSWDVQRDVAQPIWMTVTIPKEIKAGIYNGTFVLHGHVHGQSFTLKKSLDIKVYPVQLEVPSLWVTNWYTNSPDKLKYMNGGKLVVPYSEKYWQCLEQIAQKMKVCYQNVVLISPLKNTICTEKDGVYSFDFTHFDQTVNLFQKAGVLKRIEGGHLATRSGNWDSPFAMFVPVQEDGKQVLEKVAFDSKEAQNFYKQFIPAFMSHLQVKKWKDIYWQHIADEPIDSNFKSYVAIGKFIKKLSPKISFMEACHSHKLDNVLSIWVPQLNMYKESYDFYCKRQKAGDQVWFYTCLGPQGEFANRFLELPLLKTRIIQWLNFKFGATGYLHWGLNFWKGKNPFDEASGMIGESGNVLPGGDSWIVYPKDGKLYGSLRLEAMRDGIEDYTLLKMLQKKNPEEASRLCRSVVYDWTHYDIESSHFRDVRRKILEALSE